MHRIDHAVKVTLAGGPVISLAENLDVDSYFFGDYTVPQATAPAGRLEVLIPDLSAANVEAVFLLVSSPQATAQMAFDDPDPANNPPGVARRLRGPILMVGAETVAQLGLTDRLYFTNPDPNLPAVVRVLIGINNV
jgi:hypothetical protein